MFDYEIQKWQRFFEENACFRTVCLECAQEIRDFNAREKRRWYKKEKFDKKQFKAVQTIVGKKKKESSYNSEEESEEDSSTERRGEFSRAENQDLEVVGEVQGQQEEEVKKEE